MRVATSCLSLMLHSAALAVVARTEAAYAQDAPASTPPSDPGALTSVPPAPAHPSPTAATVPLTESPTRSALPPGSAPALVVAARLRAAGRYYSETAGPNGSNVDSTYAELRASGRVYGCVGLTLGLYAVAANAPVGIEDAYVAFDFADPVHLWVGQMLVPSDRTNLGGPFSAIPWNFYPGVLAYAATTTVVAVPRGNSIGRDGGAALWGDLADSRLHYALGIFLPSLPLPGPTANPRPVAPTALLSGRLGFDFLGQESGYSAKSSYFGDQDVIALGVGGQFQRAGSVGVVPTSASGIPTGPGPPADDYAEFSSDALVEMRLGGGWFFTLDGAYYHYVGNNEPVRDEVSFLGAVATSKLGPGNIQPYCRWQSFTPSANGVDLRTFAVDAGLNYLIRGPALRIMLAYEHVDLGNRRLSDVGQLGAQATIF